MKAKKNLLIAFGELKIGEKFKDGGIIYIKKHKNKAKDESGCGFIIYHQTDAIVERVK